MQVSQYQRDNSNSTTAAASLLCTQRFHAVSRLNFDIKKIDSVCTFGIGECVSLIGNYSKILIERMEIQPKVRQIYIEIFKILLENENSKKFQFWRKNCRNFEKRHRSTIQILTYSQFLQKILQF